MTNLSVTERILGGLWGAVVGDALGVPVEFQSREQLRQNPVQDMRGYGTYHQPAGTWSNDSSLMLCRSKALKMDSTPGALGCCLSAGLIRLIGHLGKRYSTLEGACARR